MASNNVGKLVGGGIAVVVGLFILYAMVTRGNVQTTVVADVQNGNCVVISKFDVENAKKDKFVEWVIDNRCRPPGMITVGNFRTNQSPSADNCRNATYGGATWPFQQSEEIVHRRNPNKITLKIKRNADLPGGHTYYFDICTGENAERKSDPRLVIDP
ncbi:MAG TPA: hypothetical protein VGD94_22990 [Vicinamibacterales bacterium]